MPAKIRGRKIRGAAVTEMEVMECDGGSENQKKAIQLFQSAKRFMDGHKEAQGTQKQQLTGIE